MADRDSLSATDAEESATESGVMPGFEHYRAQLRGFLRLRGHSEDTVQDLVQEAYFRLLRFPPKEVIRKPRAYLYRIASNVANDFMLRRKAEPVAFNSELATRAGEHWAVQHVDEEELSDELGQLLKEMPPGWAAALVMRVRDERSNEDISAALGIAPSSVPAYISRALAFCRGRAWRPG